jgi:hypothetical protein
MLKKTPFDCFGQGQEIYFDTLRLARLEEMTGKTVFHIVFVQDMAINFCAQALSVCLEHHYPDKRADFFKKKIADYVDSGEGTLLDVWTPIRQAILKSGIIVKEKELDEKNA